MAFKNKILILFCLIALVFSMAGVSAGDVNQTIFSDMSILESADGGTFTELQDKINNAEDGSTLTLENNYTCWSKMAGKNNRIINWRAVGFCKMNYKFNLSWFSTYRTELMGFATLLILFCHAPANGVEMPSLLEKAFRWGG